MDTGTGVLLYMCFECKVVLAKKVRCPVCSSPPERLGEIAVREFESA